MKPIDVESAILVALRRAVQDGYPRAMTIPALVKRLSTAKHEAPGWRQVATAVLRLERSGLVQIAGEEEVGEVMQPAYRLTAAGEPLAAQANMAARAREVAYD